MLPADKCWAEICAGNPGMLPGILPADQGFNATLKNKEYD